MTSESNNEITLNNGARVAKTELAATLMTLRRLSASEEGKYALTTATLKAHFGNTFPDPTDPRPIALLKEWSLLEADGSMRADTKAIIGASLDWRNNVRPMEDILAPVL